MPKHICNPTAIQGAGNKPKVIEEYIGCLNSSTEELSIARMKSPGGWEEPGQTPEFDEYTVVLKRMLRVETRDRTIDAREGEAVIVQKGEWVRYSTPNDEGADYMAVCLPGFPLDTAHRDET